MGDEFSETTSISWFGRIKESFKGIVTGFVLFIASFIVLWWNEGNFVKTKKSLEEGAAITIAVEGTKVDSSNEGKLIHIAGPAETSEQISDTELGFTPKSKALILRRDIEMYQWVENVKSETKDKLDGSQETVKTYSYEKKWDSTYHDSSDFKKPEGHRNPTMPVEDKTWRPSRVNVGEYQLSDNLKGQVSGGSSIPSSEVRYTSMPSYVRSRLLKEGEVEEVGDIRISYSMLTSPQDVSVIAQQKGNTFVRYQTSIDGKQISMLDMGMKSKEEMYANAQRANVIMTWILRVVGFFLMFFGIQMMLAPIVVIADIIPLIGGLVSFGAGLVAAAVSLPLTFITIAIAWLRFRPITGIILIVIGVGLGAAVFYLRKGKKKEATA